MTVVAYRTPTGVLHVECSKTPDYATVPLRPVFDTYELYDGDGDYDTPNHVRWLECEHCKWSMEEAGVP